MICPTGALANILSIHAIKNISVFQKTNLLYVQCCPASLAEGRIAIVTNVKRDAMDARVPLTSGIICGRRSRVVLAPRRRCQVGDNAFRIVPMTVTKKPGLTGEITE